MTYLNNSFIDFMTINTNIEGDVKDVFFPNTLNIYEISYSWSILSCKENIKRKCRYYGNSISRTSMGNKR